METEIKVTTSMLLTGTLLFALIDILIVPLLAWRIHPGFFRRLKWIQAIVAWVVWTGIWQWAIGGYWESVYFYAFPAWSRAWIPPGFGLFNLAIGLGLRALAARIRNHPVIGYCLLSGVWGSLTHIWAVLRGVVEKPPMLQGASPVAAVTIAFFEYMLYWSLILGLSALILKGWQALSRVRDSIAPDRPSNPA